MYEASIKSEGDTTLDEFKHRLDNIANGMIKRTAGLDNQIIKLSKILISNSAACLESNAASF